jgi:hypothetical protein
LGVHVMDETPSREEGVLLTLAGLTDSSREKDETCSPKS